MPETSRGYINAYLPVLLREKLTQMISYHESLSHMSTSCDVKITIGKNVYYIYITGYAQCTCGSKDSAESSNPKN